MRAPDRPTRIVGTSGGPVEIVRLAGERPPVLFFPGGHCAAACDCGWSLYTDSGYGVVSFSRPGYGGTRVGALSPAAFAPLVREVCESLNIGEVAGSVGVSFGGMHAVHAALQPELAIERLVLHSCAPSRLDYPDTAAEAIGGRVVFSPPLETLVWRLLHRSVGSDGGLRRMMARLSTRPIDEWWGDLTDEDRNELRALFRSMRSDSGFAHDLRHGGRHHASERASALARVACPTLVTASRHDGGVSFDHSEDLAAAIPGARLIEVDTSSHIFWIGPGRDHLSSVVRSFLPE